VPSEFLYPTNIELRTIEQDLLPVLTNNDPIFTHFPITSVNDDLLAWEAYDNFKGLQGVRGLNGEPGRVKSIGAKRYIAQPGYYGEFATIDEQDLTRRRPLGTFAGTVDITDLVRQKQDQLLNREIMRVRSIIWGLVTTGTFSVLSDGGNVVHTDKYTFQTATAAVPWATVATATPIKDFQAIQLLSRGTSVQFDSGASAYMNRTTFNNLINNTNSNDLDGRRATQIKAVMNLDELNRVLLASGLPQVEIFDDGYYNDAGTWTQFIPDGKVVVVGRRTNGANLGEYRMTRNANNPNMEPGSYVKVVDSADTGNPVPRLITVHRGHNGGPVMFYPNGVVILTVS
jgi:hypothetical protein